MRILIFATLSRLRAMLQPWRGSSHGVTAERCSGLEQTNFPAAAGPQQQLGAAWNEKVSSKFHGTQYSEAVGWVIRDLLNCMSMKIFATSVSISGGDSEIFFDIFNIMKSLNLHDVPSSEHRGQWEMNMFIQMMMSPPTALGLVRLNHVFSSLKVYHSF